MVGKVKRFVLLSHPGRTMGSQLLNRYAAYCCRWLRSLTERFAASNAYILKRTTFLVEAPTAPAFTLFREEGKSNGGEAGVESMEL